MEKEEVLKPIKTDYVVIGGNQLAFYELFFVEELKVHAKKRAVSRCRSGSRWPRRTADSTSRGGTDERVLRCKESRRAGCKAKHVEGGRGWPASSSACLTRCPRSPQARRAANLGRQVCGSWRGGCLRRSRRGGGGGSRA